MLTAADRDLVARDRELNGLAVVLDPDAVLALLVAARTGSSDDAFLSARPTYVRYKPGTSCVVGYELSTATGPVSAYAKAYASDAADKLTKARLREVRDERCGVGVAIDDADGVLVAMASNDRDLPVMRALADPDRRERLMRRLIPGHSELWGQLPQTVRHKPERRWVGVVQRNGEPIALLKAYLTFDFEQARSRQQMLASAAARPLGRSRRHAVLSSSWVEGQSLAGVLATSVRTDMRPVGDALAALHATAPIPRLTGDRARTATGMLVPAARAVAQLLPSSAARARRLVELVGPSLEVRRKHRCLVHGDFSADQVVMAGPDASIIDFDQAHVADPAVDLASFNAELIRADVEGRLGDQDASSVFADLLDAYARAGGAPVHEHLAAHQAAALLRLAVAPFRERRQDWPALGEAILDRAERCLASASVTGSPRP